MHLTFCFQSSSSTRANVTTGVGDVRSEYILLDLMDKTQEDLVVLMTLNQVVLFALFLITMATRSELRSRRCSSTVSQSTR